MAPQRAGFNGVGLNIQAAQDNTTIEVDLNADGVFDNGTLDPANVTLNQGKNFIQIQGVQSGTRVRTTTAGQKIQVNVLSGDRNRVPLQYEARAYTMVPVKDWSNNYLSPRSSDGDYWLYNPDPTTALDVTVATTLGPSTVLMIPPNSTMRYSTSGGPPLSAATGVQITSNDDRPFYGVAAMDVDFSQDWGFALHPADNLTTQTLIGWGPVNNLNPPSNGPPPATGNESPIYVTALTTTTLFIDYNNGGTPGPVITRTITPLSETPITDTLDFDMTGAVLFTTDRVPFVSVWGAGSAC